MPVVTDQEPANLTFAHCGLIFGLYNENQAAVVEFIEYYRLMGVSKFFWNGMEIGERTMEVLRYYEKKGIMQLSNWILPFNQTSGKSVHYHGQVAMRYDCILKTAAHYDYTVISDLDEYFATSLQPPTFASIVHNGSSDCATVRSAFMEPTANYNDTFEPQSGLPMLRTSRITNRSSEVPFYGQRSKYICRMRTVPAGMSMIHFAMSHKNDGTGKNIAVNDYAPSEETILLHFRRQEEAEGDFATVPDERAADLAPQLRERVTQTWKEIFG
ncbi:hypothetical protein BV898_15312 [Hypsibius exemplaris]|uniref:Glycosyltransferase family 92 protein n=1 Tax=Hypsibius exemplaris TaxID=2072580 RepID=A0A9X6NAQ4_HYPEX|nr:hypothetical protein BV898_15312 [Hypsibius exemplaris]